MADNLSLATLRGPVVIDASVAVEYLVSPLTGPRRQRTALAEALGAPFVTADQRLTHALRGISAGSVYLGSLVRA
jgi:hypothetical protein